MLQKEWGEGGGGGGEGKVGVKKTFKDRRVQVLDGGG
jgi:hypothetical protein